MVITPYVETRDGLWLNCYIGCMLGRAPRKKKILFDFL